MAEATIHGIEVQVSANAGEATKELKRLADTLSRLKSAGGKLGLSKANSEIKSLRSASARTTSALSKLGAALKRIAMYRMLRSAIRAVTDAFKEGLKNAYQFSKLTGDRAGLANALDTIATKSLTMKNQLGAAFGGLLTAITPIVVQIINLVTKLAEALSRLIAILGGSDTYLKAKDVWTEWGDAAQTAGGQAKKALKYLAPFDELNVLPDNKSGGGGGGGGTNYGDMFEYANVNSGVTFGNVVTDMLNNIREFFLDTDWVDLADRLWEGMKEAFSDDGEATQVIETLFATLGAATGSATAFAIELGKDIGNDIYTGIKLNIHDSNGNGRISIKEILDAIVITEAVAQFVIKDWIDEHIVTPFVENFVDALGYADTEQFGYAIQNIGIEILNAFIRHVINPLKEKWNEFATWVNEHSFGLINLPTIELTAEISQVGMGSTVHVSENGHLFGGSNGSFGLELDGEVKTVADIVPSSQKVIQNMVAGLTKATDNIPSSQKNIDSVANVGSWYNDISNSTFNGTKRPFVSAVANVASWYNNISNSNFNGSKKPFIPSVADMGAWYNDISNSNFNGTKKPFIPSVADMGAWYNNISNSTYNGGKYPFIYSVANMGDYKNNLGTPSIGSIAKLNDYSIKDSLKYGSYLQVDSKIYIAGQTNTPTISANISANNVNMAKAGGGAFYGGSWHDIPQYAGGTLRAHGSLFLAGEAGPEVVGHVGGRTEVLNRSQLASTMYAAVRSAMSSTGFRVSGALQSGAAGEGSSEDVLYKAFRRALDETDFSGDIDLDGETVYRAMVRRNRQNTRLTGVNALA